MAVSSNFFDSKRFRKEFGKFQPLIDIPDLIEVQKKSYKNFLQEDVQPDKRETLGLARHEPNH
jgi:DNA-directed RNA polymerase subunit beta